MGRSAAGSPVRTCHETLQGLRTQTRAACLRLASKAAEPAGHTEGGASGTDPVLYTPTWILLRWFSSRSRLHRAD